MSTLQKNTSKRQAPIQKKPLSIPLHTSIRSRPFLFFIMPTLMILYRYKSLFCPFFYSLWRKVYSIRQTASIFVELYLFSSTLNSRCDTQDEGWCFVATKKMTPRWPKLSASFLIRKLSNFIRRREFSPQSWTRYSAVNTNTSTAGRICSPRTTMPAVKSADCCYPNSGSSARWKTGRLI